MDEVKDSFLVYFEDPFWVGVIETCYKNQLSVSKVTFGPEPKEYQVYEFLNRKFYRLKFSPTVEMSAESTHKVNPKRLQRQAKKEVATVGIGTKSQQALKKQQEEAKKLRKACKKRRLEEEKERQFLLRQQKKKEKHKGR